MNEEEEEDERSSLVLPGPILVKPDEIMQFHHGNPFSSDSSRDQSTVDRLRSCKDQSTVDRSRPCFTAALRPIHTSAFSEKRTDGRIRKLHARRTQAFSDLACVDPFFYPCVKIYARIRKHTQACKAVIGLLV
ncbi:hypothetical protein EYF80_037311 [Liparis tanakae]|uniref:Uncharacterized protein n=1 Tax=Liparis tanakae TaxID=230148 RepID=A0A4Z2GI66_9TELE|nr:hypothetical protein EYF80_037311 [Liparis tanakae]